MGVPSSSSGFSMEPVMPGRAGARQDPTPTRAGRMRAARCCGSSSPTDVQIRPGQPSRLEVSTKHAPGLEPGAHVKPPSQVSAE